MPTSQIAVVGRITRNLAAAVSLPQTLAASALEAARALAAPCSALLVWDEAISALKVGATHGFEPDFDQAANAALRIGAEDLAQRAMSTGELQECPDLLREPPAALTPLLLDAGIHSAFAVPLTFSSQGLGALIIYRNEPSVLSVEEQVLLTTLGHLVSAALYTARLLSELQQANERLEAANRLKNEFVAIASHELRTPMTAMKGYAILLQEPDLSPEDQAGAMRIVVEQTDRLTRILDDLLDLATLESGRMSVVISDVDATLVLDRTRALLARKYPDRPLELALVSGHTELCTDADKFEQIMLNLADNACKYSPPGSPIVIESRRVGAELEIRVHNDGPGLSATEQALIFEKFHRLDRTRRQASGTGLGLFITRQLVDLLGGRIWIESGENAGVTFCFLLPDLPAP